jgi:flagellar M-ring protein FliF
MADQSSLDSTLSPQAGLASSPLLKNLTNLSVAKQISLVIAFAATISLALGIILWSQSTSYTLLFGSMDAKDLSQVVQALDKDKVKYKLDGASGAVLVPSDKVYALRLKLAAEGYPKQVATGYQLLDIDQGFGISQFRENTRYHRAIEGELAKSVASLNPVESARVMLGLPKRSVFVRKQRESTASVVVKLYPGRSLDEQQVSAIVYLVSASVPNLKAKGVTVVDQNGNLLTSNNQVGSIHMSMRQLDYTRTVEQTLSDRIIKLLSPVVGGRSKVRAQVTAVLDFTQQEQTRENYQPDPEAIRSEQEIRNINRNDKPGGIPGTLTNQPPKAGIAPETGYDAAVSNPNIKSLKSKTTKNFELDKTISHITNAVGTIRRLSVAVVIDDKISIDDKGKIKRTPLTEKELAGYRQLISDTVGLDETRGDTLSVVNASFAPEIQDKVAAIPIWEQSWFWNVMKQVLAGLAVLVIIFGVIRPMLKDLSKPEEAVLDYPEDVREEEEELENTDEISKALEQMNEEVAQVAEEVQEDSQAEYDLIEKVKALVAADPKTAAHIIKQWLGEGA